MKEFKVENVNCPNHTSIFGGKKFYIVKTEDGRFFAQCSSCDKLYEFGGFKE